MVKRKNKVQQAIEPQWYMSATNIPTYNYNVYYMKKSEKIMYFLIAFIIGAVIGYLFYGGLAKEDGYATKTTYILNIVICSIVGLVAAKIFVPSRQKSIIEKQRRKLNNQFRDMLEALNTSLGAGKNVVDSFKAVYDDMKVQYEEDAYILKELEVIISGMANNIDIEVLLEDFGRRSGIDDISSFANVFKICYRKGGNIKDTIRSTHSILSDKMEINEEIETIVTSSKTEQNMMLVMPVILVGMIKMMSPDFAEKFASTTGVISTTIAVVIFFIAYMVGKKVLDIKV